MNNSNYYEKKYIKYKNKYLTELNSMKGGTTEASEDTTYHPYKLVMEEAIYSTRSSFDKLTPNKNSVQSTIPSYLPFDVKYSIPNIAIGNFNNKNTTVEQRTKDKLAMEKFTVAGGKIIDTINNTNNKSKSMKDIEIEIQEYIRTKQIDVPILAIFGNSEDDEYLFNHDYVCIIDLNIIPIMPICRVALSSNSNNNIFKYSNIISEVAPILNKFAVPLKKSPSEKSPSEKSPEKHVFITGGSGTLGRSIIEKLLANHTHVYNLIRSADQVLNIKNEFYHYTVIGNDGLYNERMLVYLFNIIRIIKINNSNGIFYVILSAADKDTPTVVRTLKNNNNQTADNHWSITSAKIFGRLCIKHQIKLIYISTIYINKGAPVNNNKWENTQLEIKPSDVPSYEDKYIYGYTKVMCENTFIKCFQDSPTQDLLIIRLPGLFDYNMSLLTETSFGTVIKDVINLSHSQNNIQQRSPIDVSDVSEYINIVMNHPTPTTPTTSKFITSLYGKNEYTKYTFATFIHKMINDKILTKIKLGTNDIYFKDQFNRYKIVEDISVVPFGLPTVERSVTELSGITDKLENLSSESTLYKLIKEELIKVASDYSENNKTQILHIYNKFILEYSVRPTEDEKLTNDDSYNLMIFKFNSWFERASTFNSWFERASPKSIKDNIFIKHIRNKSCIP